ncbi:unnamed protein product [Victoria cruziana]
MVVGEGERGGGGRGEKGIVLMWGYLPGASPHRASILSPERMPETAGDTLVDVCGGGCGFAVAISESGLLNTWGSTDDLGQGYAVAGKHEEMPEPFPLPTEAAIVKAAASWAHCVAVTVNGDVYAWGWKECVPTGKVLEDWSIGENLKKILAQNHNDSLTEQARSRSQVGEEGSKRKKLSETKQTSESSRTVIDEAISDIPCLVSFTPGVRIATVAAGGRHTLALSDMGQVWGWGYGGDGQLGLGSRIRIVSSPQPIACVETSSYFGDRISLSRGGLVPDTLYKVPGTYVKAIACGGRHSAVVTDAGTLLTFGWGLQGQCGQGSSDDELSPTVVSSLLGIGIGGVAAGLWHTVCVSVDGRVYAFGGNQFGQLGTGNNQAETLPRLLLAPSLERNHAKLVSCGARHSAIVTEGGEVFCWGWNKYGQLGLGDTINRSTPCPVQISDFRPRNIACGWWHTLLLVEE